MSIVTGLEMRTAAIGVCGLQLKALDAPVLLLATQGTGVSDANAVDAYLKLKIWNAGLPVEYGNLTTHATELKKAVVDAYNKREVPLVGVIPSRPG